MVHYWGEADTYDLDAPLSYYSLVQGEKDVLEG